MSRSTHARTWPVGWDYDSECPERNRRDWDGTSWTEHFKDPGGGPPGAAPAGSSGLPSVAQPAGAMTVQQTVITVGSQKSVAGAVLLALFFGPLGMLYATVPGALVMFAVNIIVAVTTVGVGLLLTIPIGALWAGMAASSHNGRLGGASQIVQSPAAATTSPAAWHDDPSGSGRLRYWDGTRWTNHYSDRPAGPEGHAQDQSPSSLETTPVAAIPERSSATDAAQPEPGQIVFCGSCGAGIGASARYCPECGGEQIA